MATLNYRALKAYRFYYYCLGFFGFYGFVGFVGFFGFLKDVEALNKLAVDLFDLFVRLCETDPNFVKLWRSIQANFVLQALDDEFNRHVATSYRDKYQELVPLDEAEFSEKIWTMSYLLSSLGSTALQLAFSGSNNVDDVLNAYRELMNQQFIGQSKGVE